MDTKHSVNENIDKQCSLSSGPAIFASLDIYNSGIEKQFNVACVNGMLQKDFIHGSKFSGLFLNSGF